MPAPTVCTEHLGRWGGDPLCGHCRTITGQPRRREPQPRTRLVWNRGNVAAVLILLVAGAFFAGVATANNPASPLHSTTSSR